MATMEIAAVGVSMEDPSTTPGLGRSVYLSLAPLLNALIRWQPESRMFPLLAPVRARHRIPFLATAFSSHTAPLHRFSDSSNHKCYSNVNLSGSDTLHTLKVRIGSTINDVVGDESWNFGRFRLRMGAC